MCALLECGSLDIGFIDSTMDDFNVSSGDIIEAITESDCGPVTANTIIYLIFRLAVDAAIAQTEADEGLLDGESNLSIFTNCIDSHLNIKDKEGDWHEIHDYDQLVEFLRANYTKPENDV
jgi:hypothetical protein